MKDDIIEVKGSVDIPENSTFYVGLCRMDGTNLWSVTGDVSRIKSNVEDDLVRWIAMTGYHSPVIVSFELPI